VDTISFRVAPGEVYGSSGRTGRQDDDHLLHLRPAAARRRPCHRRRDRPRGRPDRSRAAISGRAAGTAIYDTLSAAENVSYFASLHGINGKRGPQSRAQSLSVWGWTPRPRPRAASSRRMKRRLNLAIGLVHTPARCCSTSLRSGSIPRRGSTSSTSCVRFRGRDGDPSTRPTIRGGRAALRPCGDHGQGEDPRGGIRSTSFAPGRRGDGRDLRGRSRPRVSGPPWNGAPGHDRLPRGTTRPWSS